MKAIQLIAITLLLSTQATAQFCPGVPGEVEWHYWRFLPDDEFGELTAHEFFPNTSDGFESLNSLVTPYRFENNYGSLIRGYISVPSSEDILFNITGDDKVRFFLSTDQSPSNLQLIAYIDNYTGQEEHDKYPEQSSGPISVTSGSLYYFELHHVEGGGSDHATVWWRTSFTGTSDWSFVSTDYLVGLGCQEPPCDLRGTPCNDGDATTFNDQYDGFCNCAGQPNTSNPCVGQRTDLFSYFYDSIPGNDLNDLYESVDYPTLPDRGENLSILGRYRENVHAEYGSLVQGYLTVPVSGNYQFNITGDNQSIFFLSSDDDPVNKQAHQILTDYSTGMTQHDEQIYQSTSNIWLVAGQYYYFELNHKQGGGWGHYRIFWQTPFTPPDQWKTIPDFYIYDFACELACIPQGTPCDDGDPFTNNDQYDGNCMCAGTPCSGPDCDDPVANYTHFDECGITNELDDRPDAAWLSCQESTSSNPGRGSGHWLQYDLGDIHRLFDSHVWNYNVPGNTNQGIGTVAIDLSEDGVNWTEFGQFNWADAPGTSNYAGFVGPDFNGEKARYLLFTSLDNQTCAGLSKMAISARQCGPEGSVCDDGNPLTYNDKFDSDCNCTGQIGNPLDCLQDSLFLGDSLLLHSNYSAIRFLSSSSTIINNSSVNFTASDNVTLFPGFENETGGELIVQMEDCNTMSLTLTNSQMKSLVQAGHSKPLIVSQLEHPERQMISYFLEDPGQIVLEILDSNEKTVSTLAEHRFRNGGHYRKRINTKKMAPGVYHVRYKTGKTEYFERIVVQ